MIFSRLLVLARLIDLLDLGVMMFCGEVRFDILAESLASIAS